MFSLKEDPCTTCDMYARLLIMPPTRRNRRRRLGEVHLVPFNAGGVRALGGRGGGDVRMGGVGVEGVVGGDEEAGAGVAGVPSRRGGGGFGTDLGTGFAGIFGSANFVLMYQK